MSGLNNPLYVESTNNARIAERRDVELEELGRAARHTRIQWRNGWVRSALVRLNLTVRASARSA